MRKLIRYIIFFFYILGVAALVMAYVSVFVSPAVFWVPAFFSLAYPIILIYNLVFLVYWLIRKKWRIFIPTILIILLGWNNLRNLVPLRFSVNKDVPEDAIKVMSFNVRVFDLYNWTSNKETLNKIFHYLKQEQPDIICFQEFYKDVIGYHPTVDSISFLGKAKNSHELYTSDVESQFYFGIATFSSFPIINKKTLDLGSKDNTCIYSDIKTPTDTIRVYNCHLESIHFEYSNYQFVDSLRFELNDKQIKGAKSIAHKLKYSFGKRASQAEIIADHIENSPYKVIVCGDFNDTPFSYTYWTIRGNLKDAFVQAGAGFGKSYSGKLPALRIDFILFDESIQAFNYQAGPGDLSDHSPIYVSLKTAGS